MTILGYLKIDGMINVMEVEWQKWLNEQRAQSTMTVEKISLANVFEPWGMKEDGNYRREPPAFFNVVGASVQAKREVLAWSQPMLEELGKGYVVLVETEDGRVLLTSRQEPGNPPEKNYILLGATLQTSESNLLQKHGGKRPPYAEVLDKYQPRVVEFVQDGGRYIGKRNVYGRIKIKSQDEVQLLANARWFDNSEVREAVIYGEANEHLIQALTLKCLNYYGEEWSSR
jgi:hypothetical protein